MSLHPDHPYWAVAPEVQCDPLDQSVELTWEVSQTDECTDDPANIVERCQQEDIERNEPRGTALARHYSNLKNIH